MRTKSETGCRPVPAPTRPTMSEVPEIVRTFLSAWSERDPSIVARCVTDDVAIDDPNNSCRGPEPLIEHLAMVLERFDFSVSYGPCVRDGDLVAFRCRIDMVGRRGRLEGLRTGFEPSVWVELRNGLIATWTEYWDPAPLARDLAGAGKSPTAG